MLSGSFESDDADATNNLILTFLQITQETVLQVSYASHNAETETGHGQGLQYLRFLAQGFVHETDDGHPEDDTPGWWCIDPNVPEAEYEEKKTFYLTERFLDIRNVPRVRPASPDPAAFEVTEREDLRSRSPSPELPAPKFPDTDPLASSTDTEPMTPDQS